MPLFSGYSSSPIFDRNEIAYTDGMYELSFRDPPVYESAAFLQGNHPCSGGGLGLQRKWLNCERETE
jgi:hypothetical protein